MTRHINPEMVALAREARQLTQKELAALISVGQATLCKFERGAISIGEEYLPRLATALDYPEDFFLQTDRIHWTGSGCMYHRKRKSLTVSEYRLLLARVNVLRLNLFRLLQDIEIQAENKFLRLDIAEFASPEKIAGFVRQAWNLPRGPIVNMVTAVEAAGGVVIKCDFGNAKLDAFSQWLPGMPPLFFVNDGVPPDRSRYTLAHELGHIVMHVLPTANLELEADEFAAEFLMPRRDIGPLLTRPFSLEKAAQLKQWWKVSISSLIRRAHTLGRITDSRYKSLMTQLSKLGYRMVEPVSLEPEEPSVVRSVLDLHQTDHGYSVRELSQVALSSEAEFISNFISRTQKQSHLRAVK